MCVCEKSAVIDTELYANRINVSLSPVLKDVAAEADEAVVAVCGAYIMIIPSIGELLQLVRGW